MKPSQDFLDTLALYSPAVRKNTKVAHNSEFPTPIAYHITEPGVPNPFWPRLPASAAPSEDKTVPRIISASTLVGCMNGATYILSNARDTKKGRDERVNYYHILGMNFEWCLLPNSELVYDAEDTQEQWLVAYDKGTRSYRHFLVGEFFIHSLAEQIQPNKDVNPVQGVLYAYINKGRELAITKGKILGEGYYRLTVDLSRYTASKKRMRFDDDDTIIVEPIAKEIYDSFRKISVKKGF